MKNNAIALLLLLLLNACGRTAPENTVTVSAAMSLKNAFTELARNFEKQHPGTRCILNFASSGVLARQIEGGAPADIYASASQKYMSQLQQQQLIINGSRKNFAGNKLVVAVPAASSTEIPDLNALTTAAFQKIVIGNPATVPAGRYAQEALQKAGIYGQLQKKTVLAEHVRQAADYTARGETAAGIIYMSDCAVHKNRLRAAYIIPSKLHTPILYPAALLKKAIDNKTAGLFLKLLLSREGKQILRKYGFTGPGAASN